MSDTRTAEQKALAELFEYFVHALQLWSTRHEDSGLDLEMSHILSVLTLLIEDLSAKSGLDAGAVFMALAFQYKARNETWSGPVH